MAEQPAVDRIVVETTVGTQGPVLAGGVGMAAMVDAKVVEEAARWKTKSSKKSFAPM